MGVAIEMRLHLRKIRHGSIVFWPSEWIARNWPWRMVAYFLGVPVLALATTSRDSPWMAALIIHYLLLLLAVPACDSVKRIVGASLVHTFGTALLLTRGDMISGGDRILQYPALAVFWAGCLLATIGMNVSLCSLVRSILWFRFGSRAVRVGVLCCRCGYRIDNIASERCPECGTSVTDETGPFGSVHLIRPLSVRRLVAISVAVAAIGSILVWRSAFYRTIGPSPVLLLDANRSLLHEQDIGGLLAVWDYSMKGGRDIRQEDVAGLLGSPDFEKDASGGKLLFYLLGQPPSDNTFVRVFFFYQDRLAEMNGGRMRLLPDGSYTCCEGVIFGRETSVRPPTPE